MIIGITGNSGSGKSEISRLISKKIGAEVIDADEVVKELSKPGKTYYTKIVELFGKSILNGEYLNKKKMAEIIYKDMKKREDLNCLTYKYVVDEINKKARDAQTKDVIIDAPLLFESGLDKICSVTIAIISNTENKIKRICARDNLDKQTAIARLNIQANDEFYIEKSDYVIYNNKKKDEINLEEICTIIGKN